MARTGTGKIVAVELRRVLEEFSRVDAEMERLAGERKRIAALAHRLLRILQTHVGRRKVDRLIGELGLAESIAKLPGAPGRKPAAEKRRSAAEPDARARAKAREDMPGRPASAAAHASVPIPANVLRKGTPVTVLVSCARSS